jgi:hypothetical protein
MTIEPAALEALQALVLGFAFAGFSRAPSSS